MNLPAGNGVETDMPGEKGFEIPTVGSAARYRKEESHMNIWGVTSTQGSQGLNALKGVEATQSTQAAMQQGVAEVHDTVTMSVDAVRAADSTGDIRFDRVNAIRAAIADGSYETPEKIDLALDRLLERLGG